MSEYKHTTSAPQAFEDVGSIKASDLYAFAGLVPKMPESVRATLVLMIQAREAYHECGTSDYHRDAAAECRALLDAIQDAPTKKETEA